MFANSIPSKMFSLGLFLALWLALAVSAGAQIGNASLGGTVTDQSGAAMPGAELTLTNAATGFEALTVEGKPRSSAGLAVLLPGISTGSSNQAFQARINGGQESGDEALLDGATMQEGFMSQSGMVSIHQDFQMSPDMIQEVKVITSSYDAQYGSSTSGQITMVSKSGTNVYHGAAFEYGRNKALNAAQWGKTSASADNEHDFGANIGGPVKLPWVNSGKHKTFFYFDWESYHQAGGSNSPTLSIPSIAERNGNFSDWAASTGNNIYVPGTITPACAASGVVPGQQFPGNAIPAACISPIAAAYIAQLPTPTNNQPTNNYTLPKPVPDSLTSNSNVYMFRLDHNWGDSDHFYFFWWRQFTGFNTATALPVAISTESPTRPQNSPISRFNWEHTFSPTLLNHMTFGYLNRNEGYGSENLSFIGKLPQIPNAAGTNALPAFTFSDGYNQISNSNGPPATNITVRPTWVWNDVATKVHGHHTFTFGGEWRSVQGNIHQSGNESGTYGFDKSTTSSPTTGAGGSPVAGFLLGAVSGGSVDRRTVPAWYPRQTVWALHGNDAWKITPKLTLNYGLRWDYYAPSHEKYDHFSFIDLVGTNPGAGGLPGRLAFAGNNAACGAAGACYGPRFPEKPWHNGFAPRLGIAYSWDQKTVVRAGYGIFYAQAFYPGWGGGMSLDGYNLHQTFGTTPNGLSANPAFYLDQGVSAFSPPPFISPSYDNGAFPSQANGNGSAYRPVDANRRPYSQQWNLTIERQLPKSIALSLAYVGNKGTRLTSSLVPVNVLDPFAANIRALEGPSSINPGKPELLDTFSPSEAPVDGVSVPYTGWVADMNKGGNNCSATVAQALLPFPQFCPPLQGLNENKGNSIYHSFQLKAERSFRHGLYMLVSYTNSKLISDASDNTQQLGGSWNATQGVISPYEKQRARTLSSDDVPQIVSAAFVYDLPFGRSKAHLTHGFANAVAGGWQISPIIHWSSGTPMWFRSGTCQVVPQFRQNCLVGLVPGVNPFLQDPNSFDPGKGPLLNAAAFESASNFSYTNTAGVGGPGQFGYTGDGPRISNLRGPNSKNVDFAVTKNTQLSERVNFQLRFQFFNAFNQHYFYNAANVNNQGSSFAFNNDVSGANFGAWSGGVSSPRTIQIGARLEF